jgi:hypothetical protein
MKWIDPEAVRTFMEERPELARPQGPGLLELDVTAMPPDQAAARILDRIDQT